MLIVTTLIATVSMSFLTSIPSKLVFILCTCRDRLCSDRSLSTGSFAATVLYKALGKCFNPWSKVGLVNKLETTIRGPRVTK